MRVLAIQSHVAHGYVGNRVFSYVMELYKIEVDLINSTHLSNHSAYRVCAGLEATSTQLLDIYNALCGNDFTNYTHIATGLISQPTLIPTVAKIISDIRQKHPGLIYICDPVFGDSGRLYRMSSRETVAAVRDFLVPLATIVKLNQTELEYLADCRVGSVDEAVRAALTAFPHAKHIIVSSLYVEPDLIHAIAIHKGDEGGEPILEVYAFAQRHANFFGTGDLLSAMIIARLQRSPLRRAIREAFCTVQGAVAISQKEPKQESYDLDIFGARGAIKTPDLALVEPPTQVAYHDKRHAPLTARPAAQAGDGRSPH